MKTKILFLSSIVCMCGIYGAHASDCANCDIEPTISEPTVLTTSDYVPHSVPGWLDYEVVSTRPIAAKTLSIKPVPEDRRPAIWDGTDATYSPHGFDKTVDWRDGVPIWDDSISDYRKKDFSDWFLEPSPEIYIREVSESTSIDPQKLYEENMADAAATRARVEELLTPKKPSANLWFTNMPINPEYPPQDLTAVVNETFTECVIDDGCPFETQTECEIWRRKPIVHEAVSPRSKTLRAYNMSPLVDAIHCNKDLSANSPVAAPLLDRYKMLMRSAQACCTDGMAYALRNAGASDGLIYKFMSDDANFYGLGARCLMMTDYDFDTKYPNTATAAVAADVRNGCLCRGRQWFEAMLAPFVQAYNAVPEFKDALFNYTYTDGLQREITVSINNDVQNVLKQLEQCP
ncbi:MAG: hypothetical protein J6L70_01825 [Alphaproteobacteria bacterium]|nr:hypothetical protein [Alphaproteobacteria bacterium]